LIEPGLREPNKFLRSALGGQTVCQVPSAGNGKLRYMFGADT